ncbi:MAG: hypothetical protein KC620_11890, partial [Myxococcales bacterium]|nr:hypothetical protein [Myxococcales bacterium]
PRGAVTVVGYLLGLHVPPTAIDVPADGLDDVVLDATGDTVGSVAGSVQFANAPGASTTTVILVPDSAFNPETTRGPSVAGLRAADVTGGFVIAGVPPGRYAVLAAFENDRLVRDPDTGIGGTAIARVDVGVNEAVEVAQSFKITEALAVISPGAQGIEDVPEGEITLTWADDSSEDGYELRIYDGFGDVVLTDIDVPRVTGGAQVRYPWTPDAGDGALYQFRVASYREDADGERRYISQTEDLRGVFRVGTPPVQ